MSLESLLKSVKYVDEQILRYYTKAVEAFNLDKGKRKYFVGMGLYISAGVFFGIGAGTYLRSNYSWDQGKNKVDQAGIMWVLLTSSDFLHNFYGMTGSIKEDTTTESGTKYFLSYIFQKINSISIPRVPLFLGGIVGIGNSLVDSYQGDSTGSIISLYLGLSCLSLASSIYIKATDPKLLDKEPFWKSAYKWAKEKASSLNPKPIPEPSYLLQVQLD